MAQKELFTIEISLFRETVIKNWCLEARKKKVEVDRKTQEE